MNIITVCMIGIVGGFLVLLLKTCKPEFGMCINLLLGILFLGVAFEKCKDLKETFLFVEFQNKELYSYFMLLLKMIGITYLSELTAHLCRDAGNQTLACGVEMVTRVVLCCLGLPIVQAVLQLIFQIG